jgi:LytS/YehU family sensor histidine kinase
MLDHLIAFLRATLMASRQPQHALQAEFAHLADYLALMSVRMGPRLQVAFDLPAELAALPVPPLLLQPLVENAIKHGLEPKLTGGRISVSARCDAHRLHLTVRDTGVGLQTLTSAAGTSFGLEQVRSRLKALHNEQASFTLQAADDAEGGTLAHIQLPMKTVTP